MCGYILVHHIDTNPERTGWYLALPTPGENTFDDVVGPYDDMETAVRLRDDPLPGDWAALALA